eukprot:4223856-Amphidinium_carterae.1
MYAVPTVTRIRTYVNTNKSSSRPTLSTYSAHHQRASIRLQYLESFCRWVSFTPGAPSDSSLAPKADELKILRVLRRGGGMCNGQPEWLSTSVVGKGPSTAWLGRLALCASTKTQLVRVSDGCPSEQN